LTTSAVLVDLYETLVSCDFPVFQAQVAEHLGLPLPTVVAAYDKTRGGRGSGQYDGPSAAMGAVVEACDRDATPALVARLVSIERDFLADGVHLYPDSLDTLRWLRGAGVPTALVSNCSPATGSVVERLGLVAELDVVVLSFEVGAQKPAPEIFQVALDRLGTGPSDAWFIDDQVAYCDGARRVGLQALRIARPGRSPGAVAPRPGDDAPVSSDGDHPVVGSLVEARPYLGVPERRGP
jgi:HAD superfamily hydrolase (TIGR01509 family)